jgi:hypothetical protein
VWVLGGFSVGKFGVGKTMFIIIIFFFCLLVISCREKTTVGECKNYYCFVVVFLEPGWICSQISYVFFLNPYHYNVVLIFFFFFCLFLLYLSVLLASCRVRFLKFLSFYLWYCYSLKNFFSLYLFCFLLFSA